MKEISLLAFLIPLVLSGTVYSEEAQNHVITIDLAKCSVIGKNSFDNALRFVSVYELSKENGKCVFKNYSRQKQEDKTFKYKNLKCQLPTTQGQATISESIQSPSDLEYSFDIESSCVKVRVGSGRSTGGGHNIEVINSKESVGDGVVEYEPFEDFASADSIKKLQEEGITIDLKECKIMGRTSYTYGPGNIEVYSPIKIAGDCSFIYIYGGGSNIEQFECKLPESLSQATIKGPKKDSQNLEYSFDAKSSCEAIDIGNGETVITTDDDYQKLTPSKPK